MFGRNRWAVSGFPLRRVSNATTCLPPPVSKAFQPGPPKRNERRTLLLVMQSMQGGRQLRVSINTRRSRIDRPSSVPRRGPGALPCRHSCERGRGVCRRGKQRFAPVLVSGPLPIHDRPLSRAPDIGTCVRLTGYNRGLPMSARPAIIQGRVYQGPVRHVQRPTNAAVKIKDYR